MCNNVDISWLLPTKIEDRPYEKFVAYAVEDIHRLMHGKGFSYEIVISCKVQINGKNIVWAKEPDTNDGAVFGFNNAYWHSKGKYFIVVIDDWRYNDSFLKAIPFLESNIFKNRRFKLTSLNAPANFDYRVSSMPTIACPHYNGKINAALSQPKFLTKEHMYPVWGFVAGLRQSVEQEMDDCLANPKFKHRYWDNWISYYIGESGEFPLLCEDTYAYPIDNQYHSYHHNDVYDFEVFKQLADDLYRRKNLKYV